MNRGSFFILFIIALILLPVTVAFAENEYLINTYLKEYNWTAQEIQALSASLEKYTIPEFTKQEAELLAAVLNLIHGSGSAVKPDELALFSQAAVESYIRMKRMGIDNRHSMQTVMICGVVFQREIVAWRGEADVNALRTSMRTRFDEQIKSAVLRDSAAKQDNRLEAPHHMRAGLDLPKTIN